MKDTSHITRYTQQKNKPRVTLSSKSQTPALSLGEREDRALLSGESKPLGRVGVSALNREAHDASGSDARLKQDAGCWFPLRGGEGKGEGERVAANQNGRTNFASSAPPVPR